ncbi:hypothetical protein ACFSTD_11345 [Novosphingobium colocasiae]
MHPVHRGVGGLMNFVLYPIIKNIIQIPYVTVNVADYGTIFLRNNTRGPFLKLLSTYNNGNLYGDCMLMLAPIYFLYERSRVWMLMLIAALVCTLSRTVWIGMLAVAGLMMLTGQVNLRRASLWGGIFRRAGADPGADSGDGLDRGECRQRAARRAHPQFHDVRVDPVRPFEAGDSGNGLFRDAQFFRRAGLPLRARHPVCRTDFSRSPISISYRHCARQPFAAWAVIWSPPCLTALSSSRRP